MNADEREAAPALPSATIIMLRDSADGPELLMVKRRAGDAFGESYTFPGGLVDEDESAAHNFCQGVTSDEADKLLSLSNGGLDYFSAAIRELFEETGILLAQDSRGNRPPESLELQEQRAKVDKAALPWSEFLRSRELTMPCDALHYFAHWVTPLIVPKRWSARFFFAQMPSDQDVQHDGNELTDHCWITAAKALKASRNREMKLPFATVRNLQTFSDIDSIDGLFAWATRRSSSGVQKIMPVRVEADGKKKWTIPGDPDYPEI